MSKMADSTEYIAEKFELFDKTFALKVSFEEKKVKKDDHICFALDNSSSMCNVIDDVTKASASIVEKLFKENKKNLSFFTYNSHTYKLDITGTDSLQKIRNIRSSGCTAFAILLVELKSYLEKLPSNEDITIFVLTDGCETCSPMYEVENAINMMKIFLAKRRGSSRVICLGYSYGHDSNFLNKLSKIGSHDGYFTYCENARDINNTMDVVDNILSANIFNSTIKNGNMEKKITFIPYEGKSLGYSYFSDVDDFVNIDGKNIKVKEVEVNSNELLRQRLVYLSEKLKEVISGDENIYNLHNKLEQIKKDAFKIKSRIVRKSILTEAQNLDRAFSEIFSHLGKNSSLKLNNEQLAKLSDLAHRGGMWRNATHKKLDILKDKNSQIFNDIESKIEKEIENLDFDKLKNENTFIEQCIYSCQNWVEALEERDCLGIALDVGRSETVIHDPSKIVIKSVHPSFISGNSFMDALEFSLSNNSPDNVHGGFDKHTQGKVVSGMARENITGMMPLFINRTHWKVAKHQMKPIMGWMVTLDPLGYSPEQVVNVPFLVMLKASKDESEKGKKLFEMICETCDAIYEEMGLLNRIKEVFENYENPLMRTIDKVPHQGVFLGQLFCAVRRGELNFRSQEHIETFWKYFVEETVRRFVNVRDFVDITYCEYFNINVEEYLKPIIKSYIEKEKENDTSVEEKIRELKIKYNNKFNDKINVNVKKVTNNFTEEVKFVLPWDRETFILPPSTKSYTELVYSALEKIRKSTMFSLWNKFSFETGDYFEELFGNKLVMLAFCYQTVSHRENSKRREAIGNNSYTDYLASIDIKKHLSLVAEAELEKEKLKSSAKIKEEIRKNKDILEAEVFVNSENITECVAILMGRYHGANLRPFWVPLTKNKYPLQMEKLKMILSGEFEGIPLLCDGKNGKRVWYPDQKHSRRFYFNIGLRNNISVDEWVRMFPETKKHVEPLRDKNLVFKVEKL